MSSTEPVFPTLPEHGSLDALEAAMAVPGRTVLPPSSVSVYAALLAIDALEEFQVLPEHDVVIVDEAHELVDRVTSVATGDLNAEHRTHRTNAETAAHSPNRTPHPARTRPATAPSQARRSLTPVPWLTALSLSP